MKFFFPLLLLGLPFSVLAQTPFKYDFGAALGITSYQGDLDALTVNAGFREINFSASAYLRQNINNNFAARLNLLAGKLAGDDNNFAEPEWRPLRGLNFESPLVELTAVAEYYPLGMYPKSGRGAKMRRAVTPYVLLGFGGAYTNPKVNWNDKNGNEYIDPEFAQKDKDAKTNKINLVTPMGLGLRFVLKDHSTFGLEASLRPTFSDYLDGVSLVGNPRENDWYFTAQIGFSYPFSKNKAKPKPIAKPEEPEETRPAKPKAKPAFVDTDKDGLADFDDDCPLVPGLKSLKGCPDKDGDGVSDKDDLCSEQPGPVELSGCPDSDDDGIADKDDKCPDVPGQAAYRGCLPEDRDEDGVADKDDKCPDDAGPASFSGCPDTDNDGIADNEDKCPDVAGLKDQKGCPPLPPPDKAIYFRAAKDVWYKTSDETLDEVITILTNDPNLKAQLSGHVESAAEDAGGTLSDARAKKIYDYLISKGVAASRLEYAGYGSSRPAKGSILSQDPLLNQQLQRRVEIHFIRK